MSIILKVILLFFFTNFINAEWSDENCWSKIPKFQNCYMRYLHYFSIFYPTDFETYDEKIQESLVGNFDGTCAEFVALKACIISLKDCVSQELFVNSIAMNSDDGNNYYVNYKQMEYTCGQGFNGELQSVHRNREENHAPLYRKKKIFFFETTNKLSFLCALLFSDTKVSDFLFCSRVVDDVIFVFDFWINF